MQGKTEENLLNLLCFPRVQLHSFAAFMLLKGHLKGYGDIVFHNLPHYFDFHVIHKLRLIDFCQLAYSVLKLLKIQKD